MRILIVYDLTIQGAAALAEHFVSKEIRVDLILMLGPLIDSRDYSEPKNRDQWAKNASRLGDISSTIALLENIVCRVVYLPTEIDILVKDKEHHMTPNALNVHDRVLQLHKGLFVCGIIDNEGIIQGFEEDDPNEEHVNAELSDDKLRILRSFVQQQTSLHSHNMGDECSTMLMLYKYTYASSLNHVLFHSSALLHASNVRCMVITPMEQDKESEAVPIAPIALPPAQTIDGVVVIAPPSFSQTQEYLMLDLDQERDGFLYPHQPNCVRVLYENNEQHDADTADRIAPWIVRRVASYCL